MSAPPKPMGGRGTVQRLRHVGGLMTVGTTTLGVTILDLGDTNVVRLRLVDEEGVARSVRVGPYALRKLIARLEQAGAEAFGGAEPDEPAGLPSGDEEPGRCAPPPSAVDGVHAPGQPWRRGKWVAPMARRGRGEKDEQR